MLEIEALNQFYGETHVLWDMALSVPEGSCTVLMGRNGVGKTTLLKTVMGNLRSRSGKIKFLGEDLAPQPAEAARAKRRGIGFTCPRGREDFWPAVSRREFARVGLGRDPAKSGCRSGSSSSFRCCNRCSSGAARRSIGRPAATVKQLVARSRFTPNSCTNFG